VGLCREIRRDFRAVFDKDPAARTAWEVLLAYPGFHAVLLYRLAHRLWRWGLRFPARFLSHLARWLTGIEIHPAARIGAGFFIDHGLGVVIGETAEIGEDCLLYQGVTLGGTGKERGKRHPTLGRGVVVGAGAKVLGPIKVGDYAKIGANSVVLKPVPAHSIVVGVPGRVIKRRILRVEQAGPVEVLDHVHLPDPLEERLRELERRLERLEQAQPQKRTPRTMKLYNTMTRRKEEFVPLRDAQVGMYVCGVTVYDLCHIGHARSAVVFDTLRRYLLFRGYKVKFVRNFTDIDDKIIQRAQQEGIPWQEVAEKYTRAFYEDMGALGVEPADVEPRATEHIPEMIEMIKGLIERGHAYVLQGDVYFSVQSYPEYGKLSGRKLQDMMAGARVEVNERKRHPMDFALWKASKPGEPAWQSPWGPGRPGWHIECSAMSLKHIGPTLDIHAGGVDLIFPHHENELAQSEAYTAQKPFVRYWLHNGFITVDREKMSKSLGNFFTIREILQRFDPEVVRLFLLQTHYRSPIEFSDEPLREAEHSLERFYETMERVEEFLAQPGQHKRCPQGLREATEAFRNRFLEAMDDDLNTALAIGHAFELLREINRFLDQKPSGAEAREVLQEAREGLLQAGKVLGLWQRPARAWVEALLKVKALPLSPQQIEAKVQERAHARARKDWPRADAIREELLRQGILLEDRPRGTVWRVRL